MKISKLTTNGRITIPAPLRKKYGLTPGRRVKFEIAEDRTCLAGRQLEIIPLATPEEIQANIGFLGMKGKLLKSLMDGKSRESVRKKLLKIYFAK